MSTYQITDTKEQHQRHNQPQQPSYYYSQQMEQAPSSYRSNPPVAVSQIGTAQPVYCQCPHCGGQIQTKTKTALTAEGHACCLLEFFLQMVCSGGFGNCCPNERVTEHYCPMCNQLIGKYTR